MKDVIQLLKASPKDLPSREAWLTWLGNVETEDTEVDLNALLHLLRGCLKKVPVEDIKVTGQAALKGTPGLAGLVSGL